MDIEIHKNNLKKYIEEDMAFKEPLKNISDFDKYCYNHCLDIKEVLSELEKKDKIINLIAERLVEDTEWFYSEFDNYKKQDFIKYFTNKVEEEIKE